MSWLPRGLVLSHSNQVTCRHTYVPLSLKTTHSWKESSLLALKVVNIEESSFLVWAAASPSIDGETKRGSSSIEVSIVWKIAGSYPKHVVPSLAWAINIWLIKSRMPGALCARTQRSNHIEIGENKFSDDRWEQVLRLCPKRLFYPIKDIDGIFYGKMKNFDLYKALIPFGLNHRYWALTLPATSSTQRKH